MLVLTILLLVFGIAAFVASLYLLSDSTLDATATDVTAILATFGLLLCVSATICGFWHGYSSGRVKGLVESKKYEIVSNEDYSLKELESFLSISGVYLKEVEDEVADKEIEDGE